MHTNCVDLWMLNKNVWNQELGKIECVFHCMMIGWWLSTLRFAKYQLPIAQSISVTPVSPHTTPVARSNSRIPESPQMPLVTQPIPGIAVSLDAPGWLPSSDVSAGSGGETPNILPNLFRGHLCGAHLITFIYPDTETWNNIRITLTQTKEVDQKVTPKPKETP